MTAEQKLCRSIVRQLGRIYELGEFEFHEDDSEDLFLEVQAKIISAARKYHKDVLNEEAEAAYKRHREWQIKHMQEHPECWTLVTESMGMFGDNTEFVPFVPEKWLETK